MDRIINNKNQQKLEMYKDSAYLLAFTFKELCDIEKYLLTPIFQTPLNTDKIEQMTDAYNTNPQFLLSKLILTVAVINNMTENEYYLMDGQHRLNMCCQLYQNEQENHKMYIAFYHIDNEQQFMGLFDDLNKDSQKSKKYVSMDIFKKLEYSHLKKTLLSKYKGCYAKKISMQNHLYTVDEFIGHLENNNFLDLHKNEDMQIDDLIRSIDRKHKTYFNVVKYLETQDESLFYKDEIDCIETYKNVMFFKNNNFVDYLCDVKKVSPVHNYRNLRVGISPSLKKEVWVNEFNTSRAGLCPIPYCENILKYKEKNGFQCGHVVSVKNGGDTSSDNLRPICSSCNLDMGSMDWEDYEYNKKKNLFWAKKFGDNKFGKCKKCKRKIKKSKCQYIENKFGALMSCNKCAEDSDVEDLINSSDTQNESSESESDGSEKNVIKITTKTKDPVDSDGSVKGSEKNVIKITTKTKECKKNASESEEDPFVIRKVVKKVVAKKKN
jgi:hypothetical protein